MLWGPGVVHRDHVPLRVFSSSTFRHHTTYEQTFPSPPCIAEVPDESGPFISYTPAACAPSVPSKVSVQLTCFSSSDPVDRYAFLVPEVPGFQPHFPPVRPSLKVLLLCFRINQFHWWSIQHSIAPLLLIRFRCIWCNRLACLRVHRCTHR